MRLGGCSSTFMLTSSGKREIKSLSVDYTCCRSCSVESCIHSLKMYSVTVMSLVSSNSDVIGIYK